MERRWYTPKEVAKLIPVDVDRVRQWMREGLLPYCELSERKRVILHDDLEAFILSHRVSNKAS